jgi:hypothetical protein
MAIHWLSMTVGEEYRYSLPCSYLKPTAMPYGFTDRKVLFFVSGSVLREMVKPCSREKRREQGFFPVVCESAFSQTVESVKDTK